MRALRAFDPLAIRVGVVAEWMMALASKSRRCNSLAGSNPAGTAMASWQRGLMQLP